jgi:hypothetical protein
MKKTVSFMRKDVYSPSQMDKAIQFLNPLFDNNNELFKALLKEKLAYLDGKNFTYILDQNNNIKYRIMGNCMGPIIYVRDILSIDEPDTTLL